MMESSKMEFFFQTLWLRMMSEHPELRETMIDLELRTAGLNPKPSEESEPAEKIQPV